MTASCMTQRLTSTPIVYVSSSLPIEPHFSQEPQHDFTFRNKAALLTEIQRHTRRGGGLSVRALKDSWKDAPQAIEELEAEGEVLVTRTTKDQQMRMVFWNEIKPVEGTGGMPVDQGTHALSLRPKPCIEYPIEFRDLWHKLKVPPDADLLRALSQGSSPPLCLLAMSY